MAGVSEVIWDANVMQGFHTTGCKGLNNQAAVVTSNFTAKKITVITCSLQPEHQEVKRKKILVKGGEHKYRQIQCVKLKHVPNVFNGSLHIWIKPFVMNGFQSLQNIH